ncbi:hypothetical protein B0T21DRAFT_101916 [Apiosordaria backusii]|uniref:Uncharacterized protein n=1 Tax=Apiosordaria backusii TaxID=314023 RepID=A0AA40ETX6_9PEZI|nr:hypothetical protein B0T21DRAFT_101916 [Apiosordaria backusii]
MLSSHIGIRQAITLPRESQHTLLPTSVWWPSNRIGIPMSRIKDWSLTITITYDHTQLRIRDPVRSPLVKQLRAELVLRWVTTGESSVLYVFASFLGST